MNKKKNQYALTFWIAIALIISLNLLLWLYVNQVENRFSDELKTRLLSTNRYISQIIDEELLSAIIPGERNSLAYISVLQQLETIRRQDSLQSIFLLAADGSIIVASPEILSLQREVSRKNNKRFVAALNGNFLASPAEKVENEWFMSSYGPISSIDGFVTGIQIVEAKAGYFETLEQLRNSLLLFSIINLLVIAIIALFLFRFIKSTLSYQSTLKDQEHLVQLGTMAASVAHEIRNPLSIIAGSNELIKKKYADKEDDLFTYIPAETKRLNLLIENFLAFSRTPKVEVSAFFIKPFLERILVGVTAHSKIATKIDPLLVTQEIKNDKNILEQAVLNILKNALDVSGENDKIVISALLLKSNLIIRIIDQGPGIDPNIIGNIFQPFFTTKEKGTGLGLAITGRLIQLLNGSISIETNKPTGSVFIIKVPQKLKAVDA